MVSSAIYLGALVAFATAHTGCGQTSYVPPIAANGPPLQKGMGPGPNGCDPCEMPYQCDPGCDFWLKNGGDCERPHQEAFLNYCGFKKYGQLISMKDACPEQCMKPKKCLPFCKMFGRRDKVCKKHVSSCSGCAQCLWKGKGFTPEHKTCPLWCSKYMFKEPSPAVNPGDKPGCYAMPACQGCPECNWQKVETAAIEAQKDPLPLQDILGEWSCNEWCTKTHKPVNLCNYPHCRGCPSCEVPGLRRLDIDGENATVIEVPYVSV